MSRKRAGLLRSILKRLNGDSSGLYTDAVLKDWHSGSYSLSDVIYALRAGFAPSTIKFLGINPRNRSNYLSERDYFGNHPYNRWSIVRINDKYSIRYSLSAYAEYLPDYYALVSDGALSKLPDWPEEIEFDRGEVASFDELLSRFGKVVVKRLGGCGGEGFALVSRNAGGGDILVNGVQYSIDEYYNRLIVPDSEYIVTSVVKQHEKYQKAWSNATHCFRIQTATVDGEPRTLFNFVRFGGERQKWCTGHTLDGSLFAEVKEDGAIHSAYRYEENGVEKYYKHPDTGEEVCGPVPHWSEICDKLLEMHRYLADLDYLGWDVVVTDDGFKILEVNSLTAITPVQFFHPIMRDSVLNQFFNQAKENKRNR